MTSAKISLKKTVKDELLFSALVESSSVYVVTINDKTERLRVGDKTEFEINTNAEGKIFNLSVSPKMPTNANRKLRINFIRKNDEDNADAMVVATVGNPYRVTTDGSGKYIIVHEKANNVGVLNGAQTKEFASSV